MGHRPSLLALAAILLSMSALITNADAITTTAVFSVAGFNCTPFPTCATPPPTDPVIGSIVYDAAASTPSVINSLTSINLTIGGHSYSVNEVDFANEPMFDATVVGGLING
jgi:hypothetical protein